MLINYSSAASTFAETAALVSNDLRTFLTSDASELPQSLRQINRLLQAQELQDTVATVTASVVRGAATATGMTALAPGSQATAGGGAQALLDTVIEAALSERGRGLIGMAVGVATRNATVAVCEFMERRLEAAAGATGGLSFSPRDLLDLLSSEQGERVLTVFLTSSIRTAVTSYVESTLGYNVYDDVLSSIAKTEHREALTDLLSRITSTFCREVVYAYRRGTAAPTGGGGGSAAANHPAARHAHGNRDSSVSSSGAAVTAAPGAPLSSAPSASVSLSEPGTSGSTAAAGTTADGAATPALAVSRSGNASLLPWGQNGRLGAARHASQASANAVGMSGGALSRTMLGQAPPPWLRQVVELVRERDVRSLAVDVVTAASREATRGAVQGLMQGTGAPSGGRACGAAGGGGLLVLPSGEQLGAKMCVLASLALALCMYALSPRTMLI